VTVTAISLGQAAGTAAAMAIRRGIDAAEVDGVKVREALASQGAGAFTT
jgi:Holliday junction resolvasome RuvABC endonuclease subunit